MSHDGLASLQYESWIDIWAVTCPSGVSLNLDQVPKCRYPAKCYGKSIFGKRPRKASCIWRESAVIFFTNT